MKRVVQALVVLLLLLPACRSWRPTWFGTRSIFRICRGTRRLRATSTCTRCSPTAGLAAGAGGGGLAAGPRRDRHHRPHRVPAPQGRLPTNFGRSYELAAGPAKAHNLLLAKAAEITRDTPPGHFNAIFLKDVNPLDTPDFLEAIKRANEQGAFVFWNHQGWQGEEKGRWLDVHTTHVREQVAPRHGGRQRRRVLSRRPPVVPGKEPDDARQHRHPRTRPAAKSTSGRSPHHDAGIRQGADA